MRVLLLPVIIAIVLTASGEATWANDRCAIIRTAQAVGAIAEDEEASAKLAKDQLPVVGYDTIAAKKGDTLDSLAMANSSFDFAYKSMLIDALNPGIFNNELDEGEVVRLPKVLPNSKQFWNSPQHARQKTWSDLAESLKLNSQFEGAAERTYEALKNITVGNSANEQAQISGSVDRMYRAGFSSDLDPKSFSSLDAQVASLQGASYLRDLVTSFDSQKNSIELRDVALTATAVAERTEALVSGRVRIVVLTKSTNNTPIEGLRVYRATPLSAEINCMQETKVEFDTRSYEASGLLPIARWLVWAEDSKGRRSIPRPIELVDHTDNGRKFDLTVEWIE